MILSIYTHAKGVDRIAGLLSMLLLEMNDLSFTSSFQPRASVIIVGYNNQSDLEGCLASLSHAGLVDAEILLVDNGSQDGTAKWVQQAYPEVQLIRSEKNLGFGVANNLAASIANGEYLAFLNPDTIVEPGWLEALIQGMLDNPGAGLVTSKVLQMDCPGQISACGNEMHFTGLTLGRGMGQSREAFDKVEEVTAVSGASFAVRKELFQRLRGFDSSFFMYMEDADLSLRARVAGYRCLHIPQSVILHDYTLSIGPDKTFFQECNRYQMLIKSFQWRTLLVILPALLVAEVVTWGFTILRDRKNWKNKCKAYHWVLGHWGEIMDRRRIAQSHRQARDRSLIAPLAYRIHYEQTGSDPIARLAHMIFDTLFFIFHKVSLAMIWW